MKPESQAANLSDLETRLKLMARVGSCSSPSFSPDGQQLAFVSNLSGVPQAWTIPVTGGWPSMVTSLEDPVTDLAWSPTGDKLALLVAPGGGMNQQIYLIRPDGTGLQLVTDGGKDNNNLGTWDHSGQKLTLSSNRHNPQAMDGYILDLTGERPALQLVVRNPGIGYLTDLTRDGKMALLDRLEFRSDNNVFLLELAGPGETALETLLTPHQGPGSFGGSKFSPDGRTIYLASNDEREYQAFGRIQLDYNGKPGPIEVIAGRDDAELESFRISEDGRLAVLVWNRSGQNELAFLDLESLEVKDGPALPAPVVGNLKLSPDSNRIALTLTGANRPMDIWILDLATDEFRQITFSPHPGIDLEQLVVPELVEFPAHDGVTLTGWLYRAGDRSGPLVLSFHGGPEGQERPLFSSNYQALVMRGISVLAPNIRGSSGFGKTFVNLDNGHLRFNAIKDIKACIDFVVSHKYGWPGQIGIMGGSYGGYMTMAGLVEFPDLIAAGANLYGIVNFETFFAQTEPWMAAISKVEYGDPDTQADLLRRLSPIHRLGRLTSPTLVIHGANDTNCPVVEAEQVVENLNERGIPVEYILFPDEGHGFRKIPNRIRATAAIVNWFEKYLKTHSELY
ncbi:MAG: hypothetical protein JWP00_483 [Chloroflexi bacterium]|nr:hypothetical protein [Chloroflexota bacterium]